VNSDPYRRYRDFVHGFSRNNPIGQLISRSAWVGGPARTLKRFVLARLQTKDPYPDWIRRRVRERKQIYDVSADANLISFLTTVWNTPLVYLKPLVESLLGQSGGPRFEWILLDNGSQRSDVIRYLGEIGKHPSVRYFRVEQNLGIIGGMRFCLEQARGRYVLPVDSDDFLYPDCLKVLNWHIRENDFPPLLYTDEDKRRGNTAFLPYLKPDWDPVLFINSCYIAHLCAIRRDLALELGVYSDRAAEGSHDWDSFVRFYNAGHSPVHVPEVLYSWRVHAHSTAGNIDAKSFIHSSQRAVQERFIKSRPNSENFYVELSPLFQGTPDWWIRRRHTDARPMTSVVFSDRGNRVTKVESADYEIERQIEVGVSGYLAQLRSVVRSAAERSELIHLRYGPLEVLESEWPWEALSLFELFPDTVMVGGRVVSADERVLTSGAYFGFGRGCESPDRDRSVHDPGYFAQMWKAKSVSAVSAQFSVVDSRFMLEFLETSRSEFPVSMLGAWMGAFARKKGKRVVYSPHLLVKSEDSRESEISDEDWRKFCSANGSVIPETKLLSPWLSLEPNRSYQCADTSARIAHLKKLACFSGKN
jgi:glycosyltransferase involved in cell wall biosynthesis